MPASSKKALLGAAAANLAVAATKFVVGALTQSSVMISEGIHSLVDCGNAGLMLFGEARSRRPADAKHPFGYGMELYFWSTVVTMVVFGGGGGLSIYEGIHALLHPRQISSIWPNYAVIGAAAVFEGTSLVVAVRELRTYRREKRIAGSVYAVMRASKDPSIFVTVLEDSAALIGLAIAALGVTLSHFLGMPVFDAVASLLIGLMLIVEAIFLGVECRELIIGETARPRVVVDLRDVLRRHAELGELEDLRTLQLGPDAVLAVLRMRFPPEMDVRTLRELTERLERELRRDAPLVKHVVFDITPGAPIASLPCA